ncbi:MAG: threonine--tRNA ligase [Candidatus Peribacteraceae bacterium]
MAHSHPSQELESIRHSAAHVLAQAVQKLYPDVQITIGPPIDYGCYYDFLFSKPISDEDFPKIEKEMRSIINQGQTFEVESLAIRDAIAYWKKKGQTFKVELIRDLEKEGVKEVTLYKNIGRDGKEAFVDLCRGGHVQSTKDIPADGFKILSLAGAYWRGDEKNAQLTRIYVAVFSSKEELKAHLAMVEEAKKRDHRKLGKELDLFSLHEEGQGFPFWHSHGTELFVALQQFLREKNRVHGYTEIMTPMILNRQLWEQSGHWDKFREHMYFTDIDDVPHAVKPMNCPGGLVIFRNEQHSYRDLPIRRAEFGYVHRHEKSGVLYGLFRVRAFTQDDAHVFCTAEQLNTEITDMVDYAMEVYSQCGFREYEIFIATRPEQFIGEEKDWERAQQALEHALRQKGLAFGIKEGEGAFYGPKIEFNIRDCIGRNWQCGTIQVDFSMPKRLGAVFIDEQNSKQTPIMLHRAIVGSLERFIGILIEHFAGLFPLWLAPVQIALLPVASAHAEYAKSVLAQMKGHGIRVQYMDPEESLGKRIREGEKMKIPYLLVLGDQEVQDTSVSVRNVKTKQQVTVPLQECIEKTTEDIRMRKLIASIGN